MMMAMSTIYPQYQTIGKMTPFQFGLSNGLSRTVWAIAVCYIIFACTHNYGGLVNAFLSHPLWQPFSRISYSTYLLHYPVMIARMSNLTPSSYFSELTVVRLLPSHFLVELIIYALVVF